MGIQMHTATYICAVSKLDNTCSATHTGTNIAVCAMGNNNGGGRGGAHMICRGRHMVHTARAQYCTSQE